MLDANLGQGLLNVAYTLFPEGVVTRKDTVTTNPAPSPPLTPPLLPVPAPPHPHTSSRRAIARVCGGGRSGGFQHGRANHPRCIRGCEIG